ncbi:GUN4 domain-containing protein [Richelia intracellularis]|uniref:GUN4 domain-containing protein n=1 Tax=Richelia intracellularis TaxID=1164990 RepID=UPI000346C4E9|nr:GUN4 domain-containing protein [Richelia intracellularis]
MTDPINVSDTTSDDIKSLYNQLITGSEKVQKELIPQLGDLGGLGLDVLMEFLLKRRGSKATPSDGRAYQILYNSKLPNIQKFLQDYFPQGVVKLESERNINYSPIEKLLAVQNWEVADRMTNQKMCELAGDSAVKRKWLYFTEVNNFPIVDLQTINNLWLVNSEGKFGFSVQREIYLALGKNWESIWNKIGWKKGNNWTRYPKEFIWSIDAPRGHLPLSNQLRGVRVFASLMAHPAWSREEKS